jgi:hypothetical protein
VKGDEQSMRQAQQRLQGEAADHAGRKTLVKIDRGDVTTMIGQDTWIT